MSEGEEVSPATEFGNRFAASVMERDFLTAQTMLAPWVVANLPGGSLENYLRDAGKNRPAPKKFEVSKDGSSLFDLPMDDLPPDAPAIDEDYFAWLCVAFSPDPDPEPISSLSFYLWIGVERLKGQLVVGHLEIG